jgi:hypothetical protein
MNTLLALACMLSATVTGGGQPFTLVANGQPRSQIVIGEQTSPSVQFAAKELQTFVAKMSGARLPMVAQAAADMPAIRLGPAARAVLPAERLRGIRRDGYLITRVGRDLCIVGLDDTGPRTDIEALLARGETHSMPAWDFHRGTLYGVYRLLEALGMRWFMPGDFGQRVPHAPTLTFSGELCENPHFISRTVGYWSMSVGANFRKDFKKLTIMPGERAAIGFTPAENRLWELRMRGASFQIPLNHYPSATRWGERFGRTHPEYFALLPDGSRSNGRSYDDGHLCYTEPGVVRETVADIRAFAAGREAESRGISRIHPITKRPQYEQNRGWPDHVAYGGYFSLLPHDGFRPCTCPRCAPLISTAGIKGQEHSRLVWDYVARCATEVPDAQVTCLAYGTYAHPYDSMQPLPPNVVLGFCAFSHPGALYYKDTFTQFEQGVERWSQLTPGKMAFWQHYLASNRDEESVGVPEHLPAMYARVARVMARYGNHVFCEMMADSILFELFNRYLLLKLFYDPTLDEAALFQDYVQRFYGPQAGPLIGAIYTDINARCIERFRLRAAAYTVWGKLFSERTMRDYQAQADEALRRSKGTPYEPAVAAFKQYYLGLMERGRARYADPLAQLLAEFNPPLVCRPVHRAPRIDGLLDEPVWKAAVPVSLGNTVNGKATQLHTEAKFCHDTEHIYAAIEAAVPTAGAPAAQRGEPGTVDGVALYFDVTHQGRGYYRVAVDLSGAVHDYHYIDHIQLGRPDWRSHAVTAVKIGPQRYVVEVAIPRAALGVPQGDLSAAEWGGLVARFQTAPPRPQDRQSSTSLLLRGRLEQPSFFNPLKFTAK